MNYSLLRCFSLQPNLVRRNLSSLTPAQPTTQTMKQLFPSLSQRQLCPACLCRNNRWKNGRRGRKRGRKRGKKNRQRRGWIWCWRRRQVTSQKPQARARREGFAARAATPTLRNLNGGQDTHSLFKKEEASVAATNPGPHT